MPNRKKGKWDKRSVYRRSGKADHIESLLVFWGEREQVHVPELGYASASPEARIRDNPPPKPNKVEEEPKTFDLPTHGTKTVPKSKIPGYQARLDRDVVKLNGCVTELPTKYRKLLMHRYRDRLKKDELCDILSCSMTQQNLLLMQAKAWLAGRMGIELYTKG